jgi:hypothetical protein
VPIADWNCPMILVSPEGNLTLNAYTSDGGYMLDNANCKSGPAVRATADDVPQGDGGILHAGFLGPYQLDITIQYWAADPSAACATSTPSSETMNDLLMRHLFAMKSGGGRLVYSPVGKATRIADKLQLFGSEITVSEQPGATGVAFTLLSQLPYTFDFEQTETVIDGGSPAVLSNDGSCSYLPVTKVYGPFDAFAYENADALDQAGNPLQIVYDSGLPGAVPVGPGDYIEINHFANTCYLNGSGASRKAGIAIIESDFWPLVVGDNHVSISGEGTAPAPEAHILWQPAWL